jgi:hypothetical protein
VALLIMLGGCSASVSIGDDDALDTDKAERTIREELERTYGTSTEAVDCPEREAKQGDVFDCTARIEGQPLRVRVTQKDDDGNVRFEATQAVLDLQKASGEIERAIREQTGIPVRVECGPQRLLIRDPGSTFDCQATAVSGGASRRVAVTVKDIDGNVGFELI